MFENIAPHEFIVNGHKFTLNDHERSFALDIIAIEINNDCYGTNGIVFQDGDVVLDVGAHVGGFCIPLAHANPGIKIYAIEPQPVNYACLVENIKVNNISNIQTFPLAITEHGQPIQIFKPKAVPEMLAHNTASATTYHCDSSWDQCTVPSVILDDFWEAQNIRGVKLLKMDCEGAEHFVLPQFKHIKDCEYLSAEFHMWTELRQQGCDMGRLKRFCQSQLPEKHVRISGWIQPGLDYNESEIAEGFRS